MANLPRTLRTEPAWTTWLSTRKSFLQLALSPVRRHPCGRSGGGWARGGQRERSVRKRGRESRRQTANDPCGGSRREATFPLGRSLPDGLLCPSSGLGGPRGVVVVVLVLLLLLLLLLLITAIMVSMMMMMMMMMMVMITITTTVGSAAGPPPPTRPRPQACPT